MRLIITILLALTLMSCTSNNNNADKSKTSGLKTPTISVKELKAKADSGEEFLLLDVRTMPEFIAGRLSFADGLIPYDSMQFYLDSLPEDKATPIYCFCRSGRRSGISTNFLRSAGYTNVHNVTGGIIAWQNAGFEIVSGPIDTTEK